MPSFQIDVSANVDSYYGANVYAVAVRAPEAPEVLIGDSAVLNFFANETNKASLTAIQTVAKDPTNATVAVSGTVPVTNIFNQLDVDTVETIPHAFVDYQVFVCVENDLGLKSVANAGTHNGYNVSNLNDITLNQITTFVDGQPENSLTVEANIESAFSGTNGDQVLYATMAFVDSNTTGEQAHWYLDQALKPNSTIVPQGELFSETVILPFDANYANHTLTKVIESVDYANVSSTLADVHDVNAFKIFIVTKKLASSGDATALSGIGDNHLGTTTDFAQYTENKAHARVKQVRVTDAGSLSVDLTGFSAGAAPQFFKFLPVVHGETGDVSALGQSVAIVGGEVNKVYSQTVEWSGAFDPSKEYDVLVVLETADAVQNSDVARLDADFQDSLVVISGTKTISSSVDPSATVSDVVFNGAGAVSGQVTLTGHPFITSGNTKVELALTTTDDAAVSSFSAESTTEGSAVAFSISATAEGYDVDAVNHLFLRGKVTTQDQSYTFTKDLGAVSELTRAAPDNTTLFAKFGPVSMSYDDITANVVSVFNNSAVALTEVYVGLTEGGVPLGTVADLSAFTQHTVAVPANEVVPLNQDFVFGSAVNLPVEHRITVSVDGDYSFSPAVPEFIKGHRYVFDNTANSGLHPLYFTAVQDGPAVYSQDADGFVVVETFEAHSKLFARCTQHPAMGQSVNNGTTGISVVDPSADPSFILDINKTYFVNVCTASGVVHSSAEFTPDASGVSFLTVGFHSTSGNIEVTGGSLNIKDSSNDELKLIAFTDARADPLAFAGSAAVVTVPQTTLGLVSVSNVFIDEIIDSANEVHDASDTRNAYVYAWVENKVSNKRSAVRATNVLNPADRLYPKIDNVTYDTDRLVIAPGDLSIVNADSNVDKFHVLALDNSYSPADYSPLLSADNLTDLVPDQAANDIFVNTANVDLTLKFTGETTTASIGPGDTVKVVLVAVAGDTSTKAFEYNQGPTSGVAGIYGTFTAAYSPAKDTIVIGDLVQAEGPGKVRVAASTVPLADPTGSSSYVESASISAQVALNTLSGLTITRVNNDTADVLDTNKVYLYAWVHNSGTNSAVALTTVSHSQGTSFYQRVGTTNVIAPNVSVEASFQATQEPIQSYYAAVVKSDVVATATLIKASATDQTDAVKSFTAAPLGLGELIKKSMSFVKALTGTNTAEAFSPGMEYKVVLLAENDTGSISELVESSVFGYAIFGVKSISNVSISADGQITFDVSADGFSTGGASVVEARAYTRSQAGAIGTVNQLVSGSIFSVADGASGASLTGLVLDTVMDSADALVNPRYVNEVHIYAWLKQGITKSDVHHKEYKQSEVTPYPGLHDAIVVPGVNTIQGTVSVFDDADGYYLGAFLGEKVAGKTDAELYTFFVNHGTVKPITVSDGQVFFTAEEIPTVFVDPFVVPGQTTAVLLDTQYTVVMIALLTGGGYSVARRDGPISSSTTPYINNMEVAYNADTVAADITQVDLHVPASHSETVSFYAAATTYPVTTVTAPNPSGVPLAARVTLASRLDATATGVVIPSAFPKILDLTGDVVDFSAVKTAYAYAWAQGDTTGNVHPLHVAANGFDHPETFPKLVSVSEDADDLTLTVNAATLFSATQSLVGYRVFAMKDPVATDPAAVQSFVTSGELDTNTDFTAQRYTALGEYHTFATSLPQDDLFEVPGYMAVMTKAFTSTGDASHTEDVTAGNSYKVYLAVLDNSGAWTLHAYPTVLFVSDVVPSNPPTEGLALWIDPDAYTSGDILDTISGNAVSPAYAPEDYTVAGYKTVKAWNYSSSAGADAGTAFASAQHSVSTTGGFTFARWVNWDSITGWRIVFKDDVSGGEHWYVSGKSGTDYVVWNSDASITSTSANDIDETQWQLVVFTGTETGIKKIFVVDVDEALDTNTLPSYITSTVTHTAYSTLSFKHMTDTHATNANGTLKYPVGWIGDTYVYNKELTQTEVFELWNTTRNKYYDTGFVEVAQVGAVKNVTFDNSVQNYHTVSFGLDSLTSSSVENADVYAAVFTRDLKYEKHATSVGGYLNEIYSAESKLTPVLSVPAGTSVETSQISASDGGWVLVNRDIVGDYMPSTIQNVGTDADAADSTKKYSRLGDLMTGQGDMIDSLVKANGKYTFRMIPYGPTKGSGVPATDHSEWNAHFEDPDDARWYLEWTQELNPTTTDASNSPIPGMNLQTRDGTPGYAQVGFTVESGRGAIPTSTEGFYGLAKSTRTSNWITGTQMTDGTGFTVGHVAYPSGVQHIWFHAGGAWTNTKGTDQLPTDPDSTYRAVGRSVELWIWTNKLAKPNPFSLDQAIDTNGDLVDLYTVNTGHLYVWARTLGETVDARSKVQRVDNETADAAKNVLALP